MPGMTLLDRIAALRAAPLPDDAHLLADDRVLGRTKEYVVVYGPFGWFPNPKAELVFVGLTPGLQQLTIANRIARENPEYLTEQHASIMRREVAFAGSMRRNLIAMLDALEVHAHLGITSTAELFGASCDRIATTSALRFPVFRRGKNYSGNSAIVTEPLFIEMLEVLLGPLLAAMPDALVIPLGKWASAGVLHVADQGVVDRRRVLLGFPHPSGANGHRKPHFDQNAKQMRRQLASWFARV